ncbi:hypothetical protein FNV43_RR00391 [Rhamnella rubrinervis]|uniref:Uncharacterized protein n=1 Tax=Rhamnella rubrinervis TaxID=2594499 RepID=A0A8K0MRV8_9ROSA|nr:hypothetical protein FNV43_RR00391 [Rhamnella rubrinervis]
MLRGDAAGGIAQLGNCGKVVMLDTPTEVGIIQDASREVVPLQGILNKTVPMQENKKQPSFASVVSGGANAIISDLARGIEVPLIILHQECGLAVRNRLSSHIRLRKLRFEFWQACVKAPDILSFAKCQIISDLVRGIGVPLKIDNATLLGNFDHFTWVLADVDLTGFVPETLLLETKDSCFEVQLYYENYPEFCNNCHSIEHSVDRCNMMHRRITHVAKPLEKDSGYGFKGRSCNSRQYYRKDVHTIPSNMSMVHRSDTVIALNDTFDDSDDKLPSEESGILQNLSVNKEQIISVDIPRVGDRQMLSFVYGSVFPRRRKKLWAYLRNFTDSIDHPWVVIRDFNAILSAHERSDGGSSISSFCSDFLAVVEATGLLPIDMHRAFFIWGRHRTRGYVQSKLDNFFCSDSCLEKIWAEEVSGSPFHQVITKLKKVKHALWGWNRDAFSDIHPKITLAQEKLLVVQTIIGIEGSLRRN